MFQLRYKSGFEKRRGLLFYLNTVIVERTSPKIPRLSLPLRGLGENIGGR